jgi:hypothetical protein
MEYVKMKKLFKNKKILLGIIVILIILFIGTCLLTINNKNNKITKNKVLKENTYTAYIKINPEVKLTFNASYYECSTKNEKTSICGKYKNEVTKVELLNDDAKNIYKDIDFTGKSLYESILTIIETANDNGYNIKDVSWTTNWNYQVDDLKTKITDKVKEDTNVDVTINFTYQEKFDEESTINEENTKNTSEESTNTSIDNSSSSTEKTTNNASKETSTKEQDNETLKNQLKAKGLQWDFNTKEEAENKLYSWMQSGYGGEVYTNNYGNSDTAYSVVITLNTSYCGGNDVITINWRDYSKPVDFIYYLYTHGYNCSGNSLYVDDKFCGINENNELVC